MKLMNRTVPISVLRMSKYNWKRDVTEKDVNDLAGNIAEIGNLHPIIVRPVGKAGTMYEVLAGRRRLEAQKVLGNKKVDVRIVKCDDIRAEIISYSENLKVKKPDSKEWSAGVKRLVDLFEKLYKIGVPTKASSRTKSNRSGESDFCAAAAQKSDSTGTGRPVESRAQAIKEVAHNVGASERSVRYAVKREEDLIPSASRALELGTITQEQANILAAMPAKEQQQQLRPMVLETREQTRKRRNVEKLQNMDDKVPVLQEMLGNVFFECNELKEKLDVVMGLIQEEEVDCTMFLSIVHFPRVAETRDALTDLLEILEE